MAQPPTNHPAYQLKVTLRGVKPPVWRRIVVPARVTLPVLHQCLQAAMGWTDSHLHLFRVGDDVWTAPDPDFDDQGMDPAGVLLSEIAPRKGSRLVYEYDFGDAWTHDVAVEAVLADAAPGFLCLAGKRACPPEDCGGAWGYEELLQSLADPTDEHHAERVEWFGGLDPEQFDLAPVNARLAEVWSASHARKGRRAGGKTSGRRTRLRLLDSGTDDLEAAPGEGP